MYRLYQPIPDRGAISGKKASDFSVNGNPVEFGVITVFKTTARIPLHFDRMFVQLLEGAGSRDTAYPFCHCVGKKRRL